MSGVEIKSPLRLSMTSTQQTAAPEGGAGALHIVRVVVRTPRHGGDLGAAVRTLQDRRQLHAVHLHMYAHRAFAMLTLMSPAHVFVLEPPGTNRPGALSQCL